MKWQRFFFLFLLIPSLICAHQYDDMYNRACSKWEKQEEYYRLYESASDEAFEERIECLKKAIAYCDEAINECQAILEDIARRSKNDQKKNEEMQKKCVRDRAIYQKKKTQLIKELKDVENSFKWVQEEKRLNEAHKEAFEKINLGDSKRHGCPRHLNNIEEVVAALNEAADFYEQAVVLLDEVIRHPHLAFQIITIKLSKERSKLKTLAKDTRQESIDWPMTIANRINGLKQQWKSLKHDSELLAEKSLKRTCYELQKEALPVLEQLISCSVGEELENYQKNYEALKEAVARFQREADEKRLTESAPIVDLEELQVKEEQRRNHFYENLLREETNDSSSQSLTSIFPLDGQTLDSDAVFKLYTDQFYRFLMPFQEPISALYVHVYEKGARIHEEKIDLPFDNDLAWERFLKEGMVFIPETCLKEKYGLELRISYTTDCEANQALLISQKSEKADFDYLIFGDQTVLYACRLSVPPPSQVQTFSNSDDASFDSLIEKKLFKISMEGWSEQSNQHALTNVRQFPLLDKLVEDLKADPLAIAQYVYNEIDFHDVYMHRNKEGLFYASPIYRSERMTYLERQGSAWEQCQLLVYLLRKAGYPALYAYSESEVPSAFVENTMLINVDSNDVNVKVKYPYVLFLKENKWISLFPWLKQTQLDEGYDLYSFLPEKYASADRWISHYLKADEEITKHIGPDGNDTAGVLFVRFLEESLRKKGLSIDDVGLHRTTLKRQFSNWDEFPRANIKSINSRMFSPSATDYARLHIEVSSHEDSKKRIFRKLAFAYFDEGITSIHFDYKNENDQTLQFQVAGNPAEELKLDASDQTIDIRVLVESCVDTRNNRNEKTFSIAKGTSAAICINSFAANSNTSAHFYDAFTSEVDSKKRLEALLCFVGTSYFEKCNKSQKKLAALHKVKPLLVFSCGLAKLSPDLSKGPFRGSSDLVLPQVDMFNFNELADNSKDPIFKNTWQYHSLCGVDSSSNEHQILKDIFKDKHALSTVKLLQLAHIDLLKKSGNGEGFLFFTSSIFEEAEKMPEVAQSLYFSHVENLDLRQIQLLNPIQWQIIRSVLSQDNPHYRWCYVYMTPGLISSLDHTYSETGALILSPTQYYALISSNNIVMNGGLGSALPSSYVTYEAFQQWRLVSSNYYRGYSIDYGQSNLKEGTSSILNSKSDWSDDVRPSYKSWTDSVADPVDTVTGAFYLDEVDLFLPGPFPLEIRRNYNSQNPIVGDFGCGWKLGLMPYLIEQEGKRFIAEPDGTVLVYSFHEDHGRWEVAYEDNPNLSYVQGSYNPFQAYMVEDTLYSPNGSKRIFRDGLLEKWIDAKGAYVHFSYQDNRLDRIESSNGDFFTLSYNPEGKVSEISASHIKTVFYEYNVEGDLIQVTLPNGAVTTYEYDHYHRVIREIKEEGRVLENIYDEQGRVIEQRSPMGHQQEMITTASFEYQEDRTLVRDAVGSVTIYQIFQNRVYKVTDPLGNQVLQTWFIDEHSYFDPVEERILTWDEPGGAVRSLKSTTDKRGLTTYYLYDKKGNTIETGLLGDDLTGDGCTSIIKKLTYNDQNLCIQEEVGEQKSLTFYDERFSYLPSRIEKYSHDTLISYVEWQYNDKGQVVREDNSGSITLWEYDEKGFLSKKQQLTQTQDPDYLTIYAYNSLGLCYLVSDARGYQEFDYDIMGNVIATRLFSSDRKLLAASQTRYDLHHQPIEQITANEKNTLQLAYYPSGLLKAKCQSLSPADKAAYTIYEYDTCGNLTKEIDPRNNVTDRKYDLLGNVVEESKSGLTTRFSYEPGGLVETIASPSGAKTIRLYTTNGLLKEEVYPDGTRSQFVYDSFGRLILETKNDISWQITYEDEHHRVIKSCVATGDQEIQEFDARGNLVRLTDAAGFTIEKTYDGLNRITSETTPNGHQTHWSYKGLLELCTEASGELIFRFYNSRGLFLERREDAQRKLLAQSSYSYDATQDVEVVTQGELQTITQYNALGLPVSVEKGELITKYEYDACGNCIAILDGNNKRTGQSYDGLGRLISKRLPDGSGFRYEYDKDSNLIAYHLPNASVWKASYDLMKRKVSEELVHDKEISNHWSFTYDKGYLTKITDPMGRLRHLSYDPYGRVVQESVSGYQRNYSYDTRGLLVKAEQSVKGLDEERSVVERAYDADGHLIQESIFLNDQLLQKTDQSWTPSERALQIDSHKWEFTYQNHHLMGVSTKNISLAYSYNLAGALQSKRKPYIETSIEYHASGLPKYLVTQGFDKPIREEMHWEKSGRLSSYAMDDQKKGFTYNLRGYLKSAGQEKYEFDFGVSGVGVRTSASGWSVPRTAGLDAFGKILTESIDGQVLTNAYNAMGELTFQNDKSYEWDPWGRLLSVSDSTSTWSASYDVLGRRLQTRYLQRNQAPIVTTSFYDPASEFLEIGVKINNKRFWKIYGADGCEAIEDDQGNYVTLLHQSTGELYCVLADKTGYLVKDKPNAYGYQKTLIEKVPADLMSYAKSLSWQSLSQDPTGLIWMGARYYDSRSGRFISADPISYPFCYDLYTYANGDPINFRDPNGRCSSPTYRFSGQTRMGFGSDVQTNGMMRITAGLLEVASGAIIANSAVGAPLGYFAIAHGSDQISTGITTLYSGADRDTYTSRSLQSLGLPRGMANGIDSGLTALSYAQAACVVYGGLAGPTMGYSNYQTAAGGAGVYEASMQIGGVAVVKNDTLKWPSPANGRSIINNIEYTTHALERMAPRGLIQSGKEIYSRGVPPSVVENAIKFGSKTVGNTSQEIIHTFENIKVVTNADSTRIITVINKGKI